jgi:FlaA1/EpsC-like NDP-sugar epimerase
MKLLNLENIIAEITNRKESFFRDDIAAHRGTLREKIDGKSALVIGGAGTIGSSYVKALLRHGALQRLYVVDINENGLTELTRDIRSSTDVQVPEDYKTYPVNFGDAVFEKIFKAAGPFDIVANFAAHKHVRSEKDEYSIEAMVDNNVLKAKGLLDLLLQYPPQHFFCVSTDKAANPVNIMGASKKLMEELIMAYSNRIPITTARFANVAYSNGSLPDGFIQRLFKKQPLSAPADVKRFFVSPAESGEICMLACLLGQSGDIFFPKLDAARDMQTFTFIAERLLSQMGYMPEYCGSEEEARQKALQLNEASETYPVYFFNSDTSGEKPYEEFYTGEEALDMQTFASLGVIKNAPRKPLDEMQEALNGLQQLFATGSISKAAIVQVLQNYLPGFDHIETGKSLDQKM